MPNQFPLPFEPPGDADAWKERLSLAFDDADRDSGFLVLGESAVATCPGDPIVLMLAATAALLDGRPERARVFLKRFAKRYAATPTDHLLHALVLTQEKTRSAARSLLECHGLTEWRAVLQYFPGGRQRVRWLVAQLDAVMDRDPLFSRRRAVAARSKIKPVPDSRPAGPPRGAALPVAEIAPDPPRPLPRIDIDISFAAEANLAPLLHAVVRAPERWAPGGICASASPISAWRKASTSFSACRTSPALNHTGIRSRPCGRC